MTMRSTVARAVGAAALLTAPVAAHAASYGTNLVVNGDAEGNNTTGYATTGNFTTQLYNQGGFPSTGDPGVSAGGNYLFTGGPADPLSTALQTIDLSSLGTQLDAGTSSFALSALIGGFASQNDNGVIAVSFLNSLNAVIGTGTIGPVSASDRANQSGLLFRSTTGLVPTGTRAASLLLTATRTDGTYNDGYFDNISLVLTEGQAGPVPEPATWGMMILGLGLIGGVLRRARKVTTTVRFA